MLLKLRVRGFKNLRDVEVRFGPLTCLVGPNGAGKSNIFDAIQFLRHLAEDEVQQAAEKIRSPTEGAFGPLELFWAHDPQQKIELEAEMLVPLQSLDDFGRPIKPSSSLLRYSISIGYTDQPRPRLVLLSEELTPIRKKEAKERIGFDHRPAFRQSLVTGRRTGGFISTQTEDEATVIMLHGDGGSRGRPVPADPSPRTVLGGTGSAEYPTVAAARREMASWHSLHLEPSSLRTPDSFGERQPVDEHGRHIAATLKRLSSSTDNGRVLAEAANRLARLVPDTQEIRINEDEARQQHVVELRLRGSKFWLSPRSLSDGTLRFLALVAMQMDSEASRLLCLEEPENGVHPSKIPDIVTLLRDYSVDPDLPGGEDNPARQVIVNSHSPEVVRQLDAPEVLFVGSVRSREGSAASVHPVSCEGNWRGDADAVTLAHLERLIGGSPLSEALRGRQLELHFGSAD